MANPIIIIDEIEKTGRPSSSHSLTPNLIDTLLPLLEPLSARRWNCPFYQIAFDMSWLTWVFTSNATTHPSAALLSRCRVVDVDHVSLEDLSRFIRSQGRSRHLTAASVEAMLIALEQLGKSGRRPNLRMINEMLDRAEGLERRPVLH